MNGDQPLSPAARAFIVLATVAAGTFPILAAFDVGPLHQKDINGPPWIAGAAGGAFVFAGVAVALGPSERFRWLGSVVGLLCAASMAAISNWIAFGVGERECTSSISGFFFTSSRAAGDFECRLAFGIGAVMVDGIVLWGVDAALGKQFGPGLVPRAIENVGKAIFLIAIAPFLLLLVVVTLGTGLAASLREYRKTGRWPRNESFIARMKARRSTPH
jgi:hypothetical protein